MTVILADLPDSTTDDVSDRLHQIIAAINGFAGQGIQFNLTEYNDDAKYGLQTRNKGAGGLHFAAYLSSADVTTDDPIVAITDAGLALSGGLTVGGNLDVTGTTTLHNILTVTGATTLNNGLTVHGNDIVTDQDIAADGDIAAGGTLFADATGRAHGLDVIGGAIISGAITLNGTIHGTTTAQIDGVLTSMVTTGTAPFVVNSTTEVAGLNAHYLQSRVPGTGVGDIAFYNSNQRVADSEKVGGRQPGTSVGEIAFYNSNDRVVDSEKLEGHSASFFATASSLGSYVQKSGDTMTGVLTMEPSSGNDQVIKLKHDSSSGGVFLGSSNSINPDVIIKNNAGTQIASITSAGLFLAGSLTSPVGTAGNQDVQCNDIWFTDTNNVRRISINGTNLQFSSNGTGGGTPGGTHGTIDAGGTWTIPALVVDDDVEIDGDCHILQGLDVDQSVNVDGNLHADGTIDMDNGINVNGGGISVASSGISVHGTSFFSDQVQFGDPPMLDTYSTSGFTRSSWDGRVSFVLGDGTAIKVPYFT